MRLMKKPFTFTRLFSLWSMLTVLTFLPFKSFAAPTTISGVDVVTQKQTSLEHIAVVVFLSAKCPCSDSHIPELKALATENPKVSFVAVHSNFDEDSATTKAYFEKAALPFPVIQDVKAAYADQFHALKTPHAFILNDKGEILFQGGVSDSHDFKKSKKQYLRDALADMKAGKEIQTKQGRTLGCVITREGGNAW